MMVLHYFVVFASIKCGCAFLGALGAVGLVTFRVCTAQLSRNLTNILKLIEELQRIIYRFGPN